MNKVFKALRNPKEFFRVPFVNVNAEEYFSLPKTQREHNGFYRVPFALPSELFDPTAKGWDYFYTEIRKQYPIQYFFRQWLFSTDNPLYCFLKLYILWPLRDFKYATKRWFSPLYPRWRASLPRHEYSDISELVVTSNFALIQDFYWEEMVDGFIDWEGDDSHKEFHKQIKSYIHWIEKELPDLEETYSKELKKASSFTGEYAEYDVKYKEVICLEKEKEDKTTEILTWFITNRGFFWT